MPESPVPRALEQSREHRHTEVFRASPKPSCFSVPSVRGLSSRLFPWLGVVSSPVPLCLSPGSWGLTPRQCQR